VFKFYNQLWVLFAIAVGALIAPMVERAFSSTSASSARWQTEGSQESTAHAVASSTKDPTSGWGAIALVVTVAAMLLTIAYPLTATLPRLETRFADELGSDTLNALGWMDYGTITTTDGDTINFAEDRAVIDWFNANVAGTPVIAEAAFGPYRCNGSRISIATGLPAVIGWVNHQTQQRDADDLVTRERDLQTLYTDPDVAEKREIIARYGIEYIVVGELERLHPRIDGSNCVPDGSVAGIQSFDEMVGSMLRVAFRSGSTVVYRVV
jgi:uncharacterized membrane protein